ncbi:MAG: FadR/GntR family transcriptional regulator [Desulfovibrio sp.]|uniref:FadR/GntR family transcriptional regulator n=1 Tax=Desulfovibrio sp. 7SRBS1 TaxID=3378064 RepID=UPI003B426FDD
MNLSQNVENRNLVGPDKVTLNSGIPAQILAFIRENNLKPGQKLPGERRMAADFGCSRNTIREALIGMEASGIVEIRRRSGCYFTGRDISCALAKEQNAPSTDDYGCDSSAPDQPSHLGVSLMRQAMEALYVVGPKFIQRVAFNCTKDHIHKLETVTARLGRALVDRDPVSAHAFLMQFYANLAHMHGNQYLHNLFREMAKTAGHTKAGSLWQGAEVEQQVERFFARHIEMLQALREQDPHKASSLCEQAAMAYMALNTGTEGENE